MLFVPAGLLGLNCEATDIVNVEEVAFKFVNSW